MRKVLGFILAAIVCITPVIAFAFANALWKAGNWTGLGLLGFALLLGFAGLFVIGARAAAESKGGSDE